MGKNLRPFQLILITGFAFLAVLSLILLASYKVKNSASSSAYGDSVTIWGTLPYNDFNNLFQAIVPKDKAFSVVKYTYVDPSTFDNTLLNAMAEGSAPDLIVLPSDKLVKERTKLLAIPYATLPLANFRNSYVDGAQIFALSDGIYAVPFAVDPLVMYWNRDMLASAGIAQPPKTWEEIVSTDVSKLTKRDVSLNILQSAVAFGEVTNVTNAEQMLIMLAIQSGSVGVTEDTRGYVVGLNQPIVTGGRPPLEAALQFYTDFSNVNSPEYSWNLAMPQDKNAFTAGQLALYFGFGSEVADIGNKNPNLNYDLAMVPQGASATALRTYGTFYGFAIPRSSKNPNGALAVAKALANGVYDTPLVQSLNMAPVRRDLVAAGDTTQTYRSILLQSALIARGWLDPNPDSSQGVFATMVGDVISNKSRVSQAVIDAVNRLVLQY